MGKKTPWFDMAQKPIREGVYETDLIDGSTGKSNGVGFSKWEKGRWSLQWGALSVAEKEHISGAQTKRWRGFTTDQNPPATST